MLARRRFCRKMPALAALAAVLSAGCQLGPEALKISHGRYNEALQKTSAEQLLLNLVRMQYREQPVFLEVGAVSAQFTFDQFGGVSGTLNENVGAAGDNPDALTLSGEVGYSERPTITYAPLAGDDFVERLLSPISVETIVLLAHSGWRADRVLRLTLQELNGLDNAVMASGPTPALAPEYRDFARAVELLRRLRQRNAVFMEYQTRQEVVSDPIPANLLTAESLVEAAKEGVRFRATDDGRAYELTRAESALVVRFAGSAREMEEFRELGELLQLAPDQMEFDFVLARKSRGGSRDARGFRTDLALDPRSLLSVMFYLSQGIDMPVDHREAGLVTTTRDEAGGPFDWTGMLGDIFHVHTSRLPPRGVAVAVQHRGHWFFIRDDDLTTKSTFALLGQIFTLQAGSAKGVAPVLTLPVGG